MLDLLCLIHDITISTMPISQIRKLMPAEVEQLVQDCLRKREQYCDENSPMYSAKGLDLIFTHAQLLTSQRTTLTKQH